MMPTDKNRGEPGVATAAPSRSSARAPRSLLRGLVLLVLTCLVGLGAAAFEPLDGKSSSAKPCLQWKAPPGVRINRQRVERLYRAANRWVEKNILPKSGPAGSCVIVQAGKPCPDGRARACINLSERTLYLPAWDKRTAGDVVQGFLHLALFDRLGEKTFRKAAQELLNRDFRQFLDVY